MIKKKQLISDKSIDKFTRSVLGYVDRFTRGKLVFLV